MIKIWTTIVLNSMASLLLKKSHLYDDIIVHYAILLGGLCVYAISFFFYASVLKENEASVAYTFVTGGTIVLLNVIAFFILGEPITWNKIGAIALILLGIYILQL